MGYVAQQVAEKLPPLVEEGEYRFKINDENFKDYGKSVLEEFLSETSSENEEKSKLVFGKDPVPLSYYTDDGYVAHVCVEHAEIKKEPDFNSETVRTIDYGDGFYVRQCWYAKEGDGFWCSYGANENNEIEWIFSKNLNLDTGINISKLETDGEIMEQGPKYHLLSGITKRYGYLVKDNEWNFPLEENEKPFHTRVDRDRGGDGDDVFGADAGSDGLRGAAG